MISKIELKYNDFEELAQYDDTAKRLIEMGERAKHLLGVNFVIKNYPKMYDLIRDFGMTWEVPRNIESGYCLDIKIKWTNTQPPIVK